MEIGVWFYFTYSYVILCSPINYSCMLHVVLSFFRVCDCIHGLLSSKAGAKRKERPLSMDSIMKVH
jgi:hypothetical protein